MSGSYTQLGLTILAVAGLLILGALLVLSLVLVVMYISDRHQRTHTIRRNYPVLGRFRYLFEHLGEFFRQYFFAMDREELPFNRAERAWVYRAAKDLDNTIAFGSTRSLEPVGSVFFMNDAFPTLLRHRRPPQAADHRPGRQTSLSTQFLLQYFRHELRRPVRAGGPRPVVWRRPGRLLDEHR